MNTKTTKGFTLIELLVVIAIIGILSSVVLVSLNTARGKSANAKTKAQLANARSSAETYYDNNGSSYNGTAGDVTGDCTTADSMFADTTSNMAMFSDASNYPGSPTLTCYSTADAYAMSVTLFNAEASSTDWCIDSTGVSTGRNGAITGTSCQ